MRPEVKRWFKIIFCSLMVVFSVSIGFSTWIVPGEGDDVTSGSVKPSESTKIPCAYIDNDDKTLYTIEDALDKATSKSDNGNVAVNVYVKTGTEVEINSCSVTKNVTLTLPYDGKTYKEDSYVNYIRDEKGDIKKDDSGNPMTHPEFSDSNPDLYRKVQVKISNGATLSIADGGKLNIGGQNGGTSPQGATTGNYAEILLEGTASIDCYGTIECLGFIKESSIGSSSLVMESTGKLYQPLCIYDWGTASSVYVKQGSNIFPFNRYDFPNIRSTIDFITGSSFIGLVHTWGTSAGHFSTTGVVISTSDNSFIVMKENAGHLKWHYVDSGSLTTTSNTDGSHLTTISTLSNVDLGKLIVNLEIKIVSNIKVTIDSSNYYLPVFYGYRINALSGTIDVKYRTKFLPGSSMYISKGATVSFEQNAVFYQNNVGQDGNKVPSYSINKAAVLSNSGGLNIKKGFEGFIQVGDDIGSDSETFVNVSDSYSTVNDCYEGVYSGDKLDLIGKKATLYGPYSYGGATGKVAFTANSYDPLEIALGADVTYKGIRNSSDGFWYYSIVNAFNVTLNSTDPTVSKSGNKGHFNFDVSIGNYSPSDSRLFDFSKNRWTATCDNSDCTVSNLKVNNTTSITVSGTVSNENKYTVVINLTFVDYLGNSHLAVKNVTVNASSGACILPTTMVAMADGTYKAAGQIKAGDKVLSYNHFTGEIQESEIIINPEIDLPEKLYDVAYLEFSDSSVIGVIGNHGFFDMDLNKYVYINANNYDEFIGHSFYGFSTIGMNPVVTRLKSVNVKREKTKICSPVSANNLDIITEGKLSISGEIDGLFNIFEYSNVESPKYDLEKMNKDIEKYGLLPYEQFENLISYKAYCELPCKYLGIALGKGLITWEKIEEYANLWGSQLL